MRPLPCTRSKGFTLIELAIILLVIGLLVAGGFGVQRALFSTEKSLQGQEIVGRALERIYEYTGATGHLPDDTTLTEVLGKRTDSYGNDLVYIYDAALDDERLNICTTRQTGKQARICTDAGCTTYTTIDNVSFIILSKGENKQQETGSSSPHAIYPITPDTVDDIVQLVTLPELQNAIGCKGLPLSVITSTIPGGYWGAKYEAEFAAVGGTPFGQQKSSYQYCLEDNNTVKELATKLPVSSGSLTVQNSCETGTWSSATAAPRLKGTFLSDNATSSTYRLTLHVRDSSTPQQKTLRHYMLPVSPMVQFASAPPSGPPSVTLITGVNSTDFIKHDNASKLTQIDETNGTVNIGKGTTEATGDMKNLASCVWYRYRFDFNSKTLVAYYELDVGAGTGGDKGDGVSFILLKEDSLATPEIERCGGAGTGMGYGYNYSADGNLAALVGNSYAVEMDLLSKGSGQDKENYTIVKDPLNYQHVAVLASTGGTASNVHSTTEDSSNINDSFVTEPDTDGAYYPASGAATWLDGNMPIRIEIRADTPTAQCVRGCPGGASTCVGITVWTGNNTPFPNPLTDNTTAYTDNPALYSSMIAKASARDCMPLYTDTTKAYFGWGTSTGQFSLSATIKKFQFFIMNDDGTKVPIIKGN